ncbi:two component transcriptional regulator, LuxR family [Amycolatopsis marina]|uniref:Two component transcriptional regulator, LuxR family n=1 Tax=Amycolatopsis marina TaxID=490629 RepID=A0A1I0VZ00_9PSEU|nr:response regulator transcription factor [Amycolatopsis marina]SFA81685.1 two component transcriptional regulator, LuxR family [Amycolatopsis marina]
MTAGSTIDHPRQLRVLLVDDDPLVRTGLAMILDSAEDIAVVGHADDGDQAVTMVIKHAPDVVLMDIRMARMDGLAATAAVCALPNAPRVLVLTSFNLDEYVFDALTAGASGFLLKEESPQDIIAGVRVAASGEAMLSPRATRTLVSHFVAERRNPHHRKALAKLTSLTDREREVATAIAEGKQNSTIAKELYMSEATVKTHITRTFAKLDVSNRVQLAILAYQAGLLAS